MILYVLAAVSRGVYEHKAKKIKAIKKKSDAGEVFSIFIMSIGLVILPLFYIFSPWLDSFNINLPTIIRIITNDAATIRAGFHVLTYSFPK